MDVCSQCRVTTEQLMIKNLTPKDANLSTMVSAAGNGTMPSGGMRSTFTWELAPRSGHRLRVSSDLSAFPNESDLNGNPEALEVHAEIVQKVVWPLNFADAGGLSLNTTGSTKQNFASLDEPVVAIGLAEFDGIDSDGLPVLDRALECGITYCVKEYNRSVVEGNLISNVLSTHYGTTSGDPNGYDNLSWFAEVDGESFTADVSYMYGAVIETIASYLLGNSTHTYSGGCSKSDDWACSAPITSNRGTVSTDDWQGIDLSPDFAVVLRTMNDLASEIMQQYGNVSVVGDNAVTKSFVVVRWAWIALPATVVFFGLLVLGLTVWETARLQAPTWKESLLPLLYRYVPVTEGLDGARIVPPPGGALATSNRVSDFEVHAEATTTRFTKAAGSQVWQLQSLEIVQQEREHR